MRYDSGHITEIAGYRLTVRLGSGGMGDVYKAYNAALNRTAAIKILHQKEMGDRFRNEAYIQSSVTQPNIARLYEYLVTGETACIIMEFVEGDPLDVHLHRKGKLSNEETENIIKQIAAAPEDAATFKGSITMQDYMDVSLAPLTLNCIVHKKKCNGHTALLFLLSPKGESDTVWDALNKLHREFSCE